MAECKEIRNTSVNDNYVQGNPQSPSQRWLSAR
jgi:hypothetical protein